MATRSTAVLGLVDGGLRRQAHAFRQVWVWALVLLPVYVLPSGLPQPSHIALAALMVATFLRFGLRPPLRLAGSISAFKWFGVYTAVVNGSWLLVGDGNLERLAPTMYYLFSYLLLCLFVATAARVGTAFLATVVRTIVFSSVVTSAVTVITWDSAFRTSALFNNPNQLGYFALVAASLVAIADREWGLPRHLITGALVSSFLLVMLSNSQAAIVAMVALVLLLLRHQARVVVVCVAVATCLALAAPVVSELAGNVKTRLSAQQADATLGARGYLLLVEYPEHLVVGAGEGGYDRFARSPEIHSSWGTVLFAYGIPGSFLFLRFAGQLVSQVGLRRAAFLVPVSLYGLSHQGLRFTPLWILVAFVLAISVVSPPGTPRPEVAERRTHSSRRRSNGAWHRPITMASARGRVIA